MVKGVVKKSIVLGILILFMGANVIPLIVSSEEDGSVWWNENWSYCRVLRKTKRFPTLDIQ